MKSCGVAFAPMGDIRSSVRARLEERSSWDGWLERLGRSEGCGPARMEPRGLLRHLLGKRERDSALDLYQRSAMGIGVAPGLTVPTLTFAHVL